MCAISEPGYREGKDFILEFVYAPTFGSFAPGYRELVVRGVDIFLATDPEIALKAALATAGGKPIVMVAIADLMNGCRQRVDHCETLPSGQHGKRSWTLAFEPARRP